MNIEQLKEIVGSRGWTTDPLDLEPYITEWRGQIRGSTPIVLSPACTEEVAAIVRCCAASGVAIVPQGGNTGMCGGAVPDESGTQIVLSLSRMNKIRDVDAANFSMEVEAGCILENIQTAAKHMNRHFALSLGAEGSCQIGGNLSTNAGGVNVLRYGTARAQVLGLEVVLADGTILDGLRSLRKDTAGYDLKQLFIGSEGTLGIITAATLKLSPHPGETKTALLALATSGDAVKLLAHLQLSLADTIEAFELVSDFVFSLVEKHIPNSTLPFSEPARWYVLVEVATEANSEVLENALASALEAKLIVDAVVAKNSSEADKLWRLRHSISEAERTEGISLKHDISVPISSMEEFLRRGDELLERLAPASQLVAFGHVGDGNLHYNVILPSGMDGGAEVTDAIYSLVTELRGSFSAEHGIGQTKRQYLTRYRSAAEVDLMKTLKTAMDPLNILNPGKVI